MERKPLPISPYNHGSSKRRKGNNGQMQMQMPMPMTFEATAPLEPYLPEIRETFLTEDDGLSSWSEQAFSKVTNRSSPPIHITLTYAQSMDGQIALQPGTQTILSGPETKAMTHYLRSRHDAILVGVGTAKADNPGLSTRYSEDGENVVGLHQQPRPLILDPSARWRVEDTPKLFGLAENGEGRAPWWIVGRGENRGEDETLKLKLMEIGGGVCSAGSSDVRRDGLDWEEILMQLAHWGVQSVMIEGGGTIIRDLLQKKNHKFISSVIVTVAPTILGAGGVEIAPKRSVDVENEVRFENITWLPLGQDMVMAGVINRLAVTLT